jgi:hypothetical protein
MVEDQKELDLNKLYVKYKIPLDLNCAKSHEVNICRRILNFCAR